MNEPITETLPVPYGINAEIYPFPMINNQVLTSQVATLLKSSITPSQGTVGVNEDCKAADTRQA